MKLSDYWFEIFEATSLEKLTEIQENVRNDVELNDKQKNDILEHIEKVKDSW